MSDETILRQIQAVYARLEELSTFDNDVGQIFTGSLTSVFNYANVPSGSYSRVRATLIDWGAIEIIQKGNNRQSSIVVLHGQDTLSDGEKNISPEGLTPRPNLATMVERLGRSVARLEAWRESQGGMNVLQALRDQELRINKLEIEANGRKNAKTKKS